MAKNIEKKVECPVCHTRIDKITGFYFNKRYYCKTCFAQVQKEQNNLQELEQYILQKYQIEELTGLMAKQIKTFHDDNHYQYKGMFLTLQYYWDFLGNPVGDYTAGVGIIPYYYDAAKQLYTERKEIQKNAQKVLEIADLDSQKEKIIIIKREDIDEYRESRNSKWKSNLNKNIMSLDELEALANSKDNEDGT